MPSPAPDARTVCCPLTITSALHPVPPFADRRHTPQLRTFVEMVSNCMATGLNTFLKMSRAASIALVTSALCGCSYSYPLEVGFSDGKVIFSATKHSSGCLSSLEVTSQTGQSMWKFDGPLRFVDCKNELPLVYGHVPSGTTSAGLPQRLKPDVTYYIYASDGDTYYGSFRIRRMLSVDSDPERGRNGPYFNGNFPKATNSVSDGS
jgi:hypothetical protein